MLRANDMEPPGNTPKLVKVAAATAAEAGKQPANTARRARRQPVVRFILSLRVMTAQVRMDPRSISATHSPRKATAGSITTFEKAERGRFELPKRTSPLLVFETSPFNRSGTSP